MMISSLLLKKFLMKETIHKRNIQTLAIELYKVVNRISPEFNVTGEIWHVIFGSLRSQRVGFSTNRTERNLSIK